jgi:TaqI-like C-terminal specificity domain
MTVCQVPALNLPDLQGFVEDNSYTVPMEQFTAEAWSLKGQDESALFTKIMAAGITLGQYVDKKIFYGVKTGLNEAFIIDAATRQALIEKDPRSAELIKPLLGGEEIRRFVTNPKGLFIIFTRRGVAIDNYPAICEHLAQWQSELTPKKSKDDKRGRKPGHYQWYEIQDDVAYFRTFEATKIIFPDITKGPRFVLDSGGHYLANTAYCLGTDDLYLLGILNSRLFWFAISHISIPFGVRAGQYRYRLIYQYMEKVPIRPINVSDPADMARHDRMVQLVEQMLALHKQLAESRTGHDTNSIQRQIDATDRLIDRLVYELYDLTEQEIEIVEGDR